jgi:hypothetical protein
MKTAITLCLCLLAIAKQVLSTIQPWTTQQRNFTIGPNDQVAVFMNELFNLGKARNPYFRANNANVPIYNYTTPFFTSSIIQQLGINLIHQVVDLGNSVVGLLYNNKSVAWITLSKDGASVVNVANYTDPNFGINQVCDDMVLNIDVARVYVSCHALNPSSASPKSSYIYDLDYNTGNRNTKVIIDQSQDGNYVEVISKIKIVNIVQGSTRNKVLIFYSQALQGTLGLNTNKFLRWFVNIDNGNLVYNPNNLITFNNTNLNFSAFYDLFQYQNELIFVGRKSGSAYVVLQPCYLDPFAGELMCRTQYRNSSFTTGYAGLTGDGRYVEINITNGQGTFTTTANICNLEGDFANPNWMTCIYNDQVYTYGQAFVRDVELDNSILYVEFANPDGSYLGYSTHVLRTQFNAITSDYYGTLSEDKLVRIPASDFTTLQVVWEVLDFAWLNCSVLQRGVKIITITAYDSDTPNGVSVTLNVTIMNSYIGEVYMNPTFSWPEIDVMQGSYYAWPVGFWDVMGNGLTFDLQFGDESYAELFEVHVYHTSPADFMLTTDDPLNANLQQVVVGDNFLIGIDSQGVLVFFRCDFTGIATSNCIARQSFYVGKNVQLANKAVGLTNTMAFAYVTASSSSTQNTTFYLFDGYRYGSYFVPNIQVSDADAFVGTTSDGRTVGFIAYGRNDNQAQYVQLLTFDLMDVQSVALSTKLTSTNTQDGFFCPSKINANGLGQGFIAVTSVCNAGSFPDSRVIVYRMPGPYAFIEYPLPTDGSLNNPQACYFGQSLIIAGQRSNNQSPVIFMTDAFQVTPTKEYFGIELYNITKLSSFNCAEENLLFSVVGTNPNSGSSLKNIATFYATTRYRAQKRCHSVLTGLGINGASAFGIAHGLVHVAYDYNSNPFFYISYALGPIIYTDISFQAQNPELIRAGPAPAPYINGDFVTPGFVTFVATNFDKSSNTKPTTQFNMRSVDTSINVDVPQPYDGRLPDVQAQTYDLDHSVSILGPIFHAKLVSNNSDIQFTERITHVNNVSRTGNIIYSVIRISGPRTYAVAIGQDITIVDYYENGNFIKSISGLGMGAFYDFIVVPLDRRRGVDMLIYANHASGSNTLFAVIYMNGVRNSAVFQMNKLNGYYLEAAVPTPGQVYIFAHTGSSVSFYILTYSASTDQSSQSTISGISQQAYLDNMQDFSVFTRGQTVYVFGFGLEGNNLISYTISNNTGTQQMNVVGPTSIPQEHKYRLYNVLCQHNSQSDNIVCITNTESTFIVETYFDYSPQFNMQSTYYHDKYGYLEPFNIDLAGNYIFAYARTTKPGVFGMAILTWRTGSSGGIGKLWYGIHLNVPGNNNVDIHYQAPFAVIADSVDHNVNSVDAWIAVGSLNAGNPMNFYHVSDFSFTVNSDSVDTTLYDIEFQGLETTTFNIGMMFNQVPKAVSWVPFAVMMGILVCAAVAWFAYVRAKADAILNEQDEAGKYASIGRSDSESVRPQPPRVIVATGPTVPALPAPPVIIAPPVVVAPPEPKAITQAPENLA